jgi:surface polysaccharide O-acyltransferase-like enzyme
MEADFLSRPYAARNTAIDTLRSTMIVLVVLLHASLAYATFARYNPFEYAHS